MNEHHHLEHVADRLKALADPTRLRLLHLLEGGERCVGDLVSEVGGTQANVSKHLAVLRGAGLVRSRRAGMNVCYTLEEPVALEICRLVSGCLERQASDIAAGLPQGMPAPEEQTAGGSP